MSEQQTQQRDSSLCESSGVYITTCECSWLEAIVRGMAFPPCGQCGESVTWTLFEAP